MNYVDEIVSTKYLNNKDFDRVLLFIKKLRVYFIRNIEAVDHLNIQSYIFYVYQYISDI